METKSFDIRGQICPSTLLIALKQINMYHQELKEGTLQLEFLTDNRDAVSTIPAAVNDMGYTSSIENTDGYYHLIIKGPGK